MPKPIYSYFIRTIGTNRVKIGSSANVKSRLSHLQTGCPDQLELLGITDIKEHVLHDRFASAHLKNEWFTLTPEIQEFIQQNCTMPTDKQNYCSHKEWVQRKQKLGWKYFTVLAPAPIIEKLKAVYQQLRKELE